MILSGKGGVGKSTVTTMIARVFAQDSTKNVFLVYTIINHFCTHKSLVYKVAVMDVDICGPSGPRIMGVEGETVHQSGSGWSPVVSGL